MTGQQVCTMLDTDQKISGVFFMPQNGIDETRELPECIVVDATYKTNSHTMVLLNFEITSNLCSRETPEQLTTIPVAGCWLDRETSAQYEWAWIISEKLYGQANQITSVKYLIVS